MKKVLSFIAGASVGAASGYFLKSKRVKSPANVENRLRLYYTLLNQWLVKIHDGDSTVDFFIDNGYTNIAIYGAGELASRLYEEIKGSEKLNIVYMIDKNVEYFEDDVIVVTPSTISTQSDVDVIVVTPVYDYQKIKKDLSSLTDKQIISLEDVIYS